jgi:hypothetical protein
VVITLNPKSPTVNITPKSFTIQRQNPVDETINFLNQLEKEVMELPLKEKKKLLSIITIASASTFSITNPIMASADIQKQMGEFLSSDLLIYLVAILGASMVIGVILSMIMGTWSGIIQSFGMGNKAKEMRKDVVDGTGSILFFPLVIIIMVYLFHLLFGNILPFLDPWNYISKFLLK